MKITYCSDFHIEHNKNIKLQNTTDTDVLVLAGDICVVADLQEYNEEYYDSKSERIHNFFINCCNEFNNVIYVVGNHEHYFTDINDTIPKLKHILRYISNLHILDNEVKVIDDVTFIGGTMWADANNQDPMSLYVLKKAMSDFRVIYNGAGSFTPHDMINEFKKFKTFITDTVAKIDTKVCVVSHHGVSQQCVADEYRNDFMINGGYRSILDEFIMDNPQIKSWISGHTHHSYDFMINESRIMCNPHGYPGEIKTPFELKQFEI